MLQSEIHKTKKCKSESISEEVKLLFSIIMLCHILLSLSYIQFTSSSDISDTEDELETSEHTALISEEKSMSGNIKLSVIVEYCRACTWPIVITTVLLFILSQAAALASKYWLANWSNSQASEQDFENNKSVAFQQVTLCDSVNGSNV